jgi:hypothetical protein
MAFLCFTGNKWGLIKSSSIQEIENREQGIGSNLLFSFPYSLFTQYSGNGEQRLGNRESGGKLPVLFSLFTFHGYSGNGEQGTGNR